MITANLTAWDAYHVPWLFFAGLVAFALSLVIISIAWVVFRPVVGVPLLAAGVDSLVAAKFVRAKNRSERCEATDDVRGPRVETLAGLLLGLSHYLQGKERVSTDVNEVVRPSDTLDVEQFTPNLGQDSLRVSLRRDTESSRLGKHVNCVGNQSI